MQRDKLRDKVRKLKRETAVERRELRWGTTPRVQADGVTSPAMKAEDPALRRMIDEAIRHREAIRHADPEMDWNHKGPGES